MAIRKNKKDVVEVEALEGNMVVTKKEAKALLKEHDNKVKNGKIDAFVSLKDINKIYPNGVQAVYDFNIDINEHDFIVLVGPSGCGKSTTLRMVAGLEPITSGYLYIDKVLSNYLTSKDRDISMVFQSYALYPQMSVYDNIAFPLRVRKYRKVKKAVVSESVDIVKKVMDKETDEVFAAIEEAKQKAYVFSTKESYIAVKLNIPSLAAKYIIKANFKDAEDFKKRRLDFHAKLDVLKNKEGLDIANQGYVINKNYEIIDGNGEKIVYKAKLTEEEIRIKVYEAAKILDLGPYLDRRPNELSGGQMQRVALGRAIVRNARLFLMDEPLSNLDAKLRVQMRSEIVRIHEQIGATTIYVTHDQTEAMTMATKIAVMSKGWVQQIGTPTEIYHNPNNIFVATFIGAPAMNIVGGTYEKGVVSFADGFKVNMGKEFAKTHDDFYKTKIDEVKAILDNNDIKKMHAYDIYLEIMKLDRVNNALEVSEKFKELKAVVDTIDDEYGMLAKTAVDEVVEGLVDPTYTGYKKALAVIHRNLLEIHSITSRELGILHNAQVFDKNKKQDNEETMFYAKRKAKAKKSKTKVHFNVNNVTFSNNLYQVAVDLLAKYEACLSGAHDINMGIRPENIHLYGEFTGKGKSEKFTVNSDVVELMGSELLIHSKWNDVDLISKISTGTLVKPHVDVDLTIDKEKALFFDVSSGSTIK